MERVYEPRIGAWRRWSRGALSAWTQNDPANAAELGPRRLVGNGVPEQVGQLERPRVASRGRQRRDPGRLELEVRPRVGAQAEQRLTHDPTAHRPEVLPPD